jgi:hypothetical protein
VKTAGILTIILAIALGLWAITDGIQGVNRRSDDAAIAMGHISEPKSELLHDLDRDADNDRFDGIIGIVAVFALIGGIVLISQGKKNPA